jgi:hypothetical protein
MAARTKPKIPAMQSQNGNPDMRLVPSELCFLTVQMLLQVPVAHGYRLTQKWEEACPDLFQPQETP